MMEPTNNIQKPGVFLGLLRCRLDMGQSARYQVQFPDSFAHAMSGKAMMETSGMTTARFRRGMRLGYGQGDPRATGGVVESPRKSNKTRPKGPKYGWFMDGLWMLGFLCIFLFGLKTNYWMNHGLLENPPAKLQI